MFYLFFSNTFVEESLNGGIVHVVAQFHGQTLHDVKHNVCKVDAKSFGCPMHKGNKIYRVVISGPGLAAHLYGINVANKQGNSAEAPISVHFTD